MRNLTSSLLTLQSVLQRRLASGAIWILSTSPRQARPNDLKQWPCSAKVSDKGRDRPCSCRSRQSTQHSPRSALLWEFPLATAGLQLLLLSCQCKPCSLNFGVRQVRQPPSQALANNGCNRMRQSSAQLSSCCVVTELVTA